MIRPATPEDLFSIVPREKNSSLWQILQADNIREIIHLNNVVAAECDGAVYYVLGVGRLHLAGVAVPWVWGIFDVRVSQKVKSLVQRTKKDAAAYLDVYAPGGYTAPEEDSQVYNRFLEWMGFNHLGWGLWQWRKSAQQSQV